MIQIPYSVEGALIGGIVDFMLSFILISGIGVVLALLPLVNGFWIIDDKGRYLDTDTPVLRPDQPQVAATGGHFKSTGLGILLASAILSSIADNLPFVATLIPMTLVHVAIAHVYWVLRYVS